MAEITTFPDALVPDAARVAIALRAARDSDEILAALQRVDSMDRLHALFDVVGPRLRALACLSMSALDDERATVAELEEQYAGWWGGPEHG